MRRLAPGKKSVSAAAPWLLGAMALTLTLAGCASAPPPDESEPAETPDSYELANAAPAWAGQPLSWEKLEAIEVWLDENRYAARKSLVARADLELAEGRLSFAKRERGTSPASLAARVAAAEDGFRQVLGNSGADATLLRRAHQGLLEAKELRPSGTGSALEDSKVVRRSSWGARAPIASRLTRHQGKWNSLTVHHSAEANASQLGSGSDAEVASELRRLQKAHMSDRGYGDVGYHFLIDPRGRVYEGRSLEWQGAHANGDNNIGNIGVCLLGNFLVESPKPAALDALQKLTDDLTRRYGIPKNRVYAHLDLRPTECPGERLVAWVQRYRGSLTAAVHHKGASRSGARPTAHIR